MFIKPASQPIPHRLDLNQVSPAHVEVENCRLMDKPVVSPLVPTSAGVGEIRAYVSTPLSKLLETTHWVDSNKAQQAFDALSHSILSNVTNFEVEKQLIQQLAETLSPSCEQLSGAQKVEYIKMVGMPRVRLIQALLLEQSNKYSDFTVANHWQPVILLANQLISRASGQPCNTPEDSLSAYQQSAADVVNWKDKREELAKQIFNNQLEGYVIGKLVKSNIDRLVPLFQYTREKYRFWNPALSNVNANKLAQFAIGINAAEKAMELLPSSQDEVVYRGERAKLRHLQYQPNTVVFHGFTSTSYCKNRLLNQAINDQQDPQLREANLHKAFISSVSSEFSHEVEFRIKTKSGVKMESISAKPTEHEVLIPPSFFKVTERKVIGDHLVINMEEL